MPAFSVHAITSSLNSDSYNNRIPLLLTSALNICNWRSRGNRLCNFRSSLRACVGRHVAYVRLPVPKLFLKQRYWDGRRSLSRYQQNMNFSQMYINYSSNFLRARNQRCPTSNLWVTVMYFRDLLAGRARISFSDVLIRTISVPNLSDL